LRLDAAEPVADDYIGLIDICDNVDEKLVWEA
ncbi:hypothetical protein JCM6882_009371, partial [Rhodosporidiobolus microsporus]